MTDLGRRDLLHVGGLLTLAAATGSTPAAAASVQPGLEPARLSLNENPFGPSPAVRRALLDEVGRVDRYGDPAAASDLVAQIAALENVAPEQVVLGEILEALGLHLAARTPAGGRFVYSLPGFTELVDAARPLGAVGVGVPLDAALANDLPALSRAVVGDTRVVYLVNPHNPSGTMNPPAAFDAFIADVSRRTLVIVDEAYLDYDDMALSAVRFTRAGANVAVFRTLDKIHGMAGLPIGYTLAPRGLADALHGEGFGDSHVLGRLALAAASAALSDQAWVASVRTRTLAGRARLTTALDRLGLQHSDSRANFVFFRSPVPAAGLRQQLAQHGILVGRAFPPLDEWIRVSIGTEDETTRAITALHAVLGADRTRHA